MKKEIKILNINQEKNNDEINISFCLDINNVNFELKYKINTIDCSISYPLTEKIDTIVVSMLLFAMIYNYDFYSKYPISEKLYYNLQYHVIPQIRKCNPKTNLISINAPVSNKQYLGKYVTTGISCGIDSLTTIYEYTKICELEDYRLTHFVYFKTGAHDGQLGKFDEKVENELFDNQLKNAIEFSKKIQMPLIIIDSNLNEILSKAFGFSSYERTHTLRNCGTMLLLQKDFSKYYYADTYSLDKFFIDVNKDIAHYEKWLLPLISNESIAFYSANKNMTRFEKTKLLVNYNESKNNLLVCWYQGKNCGKCDKCIRTLVTLDYLGKLEEYENVFNLSDYYKNRKKYISKVIAFKDVDPFFNDIYIHVGKKRINKNKSLLYYI